MASKIELAASSVNLKASRGENTETAITMHNRGQTVDQFTISLEGIEPEWYTLPVSSVALFPNDQDTVKIQIHVPGELSLTQTSIPFKVKVISQENPADIASLNMNLEVDVAANLSLEISPNHLTGRKGSYQATVDNPGNKDATVVLKASSSNSRMRFEIQPDNMTVAAGKRADAQVNVRLHWITWLLKGKIYEFQVSLEPVAGFLKKPVVERSELVSVPFYSIFSKLRIPFLSRPPEIEYFSAATDNKRDFQLKWQVQRAKKVQLDEEVVESQGTISVHPYETKQFIITAANKNGSVTKTIEVKPLPVPKAQLSEKIKIVLSTPMIKMNAGISPSLLSVQVQNLSDIVDKFTIDVEGIDETWFSRSASSIALMPKTTDQVQINFLPPKKKGVRAGNYPFAITVRSQSASKESASAVGQLEILPATEVRMKINPFRKTAMTKGTYRVNLTNVNVSDANLVLEANDLDEGCSFQFEPEKLVLGAWNSLEVPMIVRPKRGSIKGEPKRFDVTATANLEGSTTPITANCEFTHKPFLRDMKPVWRALRTIITIVIILVAIYFVLKLGGGWQTLKDSPKDWLKNAIDTIASWLPK